METELKYYEFAGKIVGKCLYESSLGGCYRQLVKARFSRSFLAQLIGLRVHFKVGTIDRESHMSAYVLLNLLKELGNSDKMPGLQSILSLFRIKFNKFNKTGARMLDSTHVYHMTLKYF